MSEDTGLSEAEREWIEYRNDIQRRTPWESHRRAMRRLRKRDFIAGYEAAEQRAAEVEAKVRALADQWDDEDVPWEPGKREAALLRAALSDAAAPDPAPVPQRDAGVREADDPPVEITVSGWDLSPAEAEALFDRVAEAAHALDEQVCCSGAIGLAVESASATREAEDVCPCSTPGDTHSPSLHEAEDRARGDERGGS